MKTVFKQELCQENLLQDGSEQNSGLQNGNIKNMTKQIENGQDYKNELQTNKSEELILPSVQLEKEFPSVLPKVVEGESDEFKLESESYALQNNQEFQLLMKTLVRLEAQKVQAVKDMERLHEVREKVLKDPFTFIKDILNGSNLNLPGPIQIVEIPEISWGKYDVDPILQDLRPKTRRHRRDGGQVPASEASTTTSEITEPVEQKLDPKNRSNTFNMHWSGDEQRKLEELLIKYPDEPMMSKRWAKIAVDLGSRTALQVQTRIQKFFIALKRKGLPVPGRDPKGAYIMIQQRRRSQFCSPSFMGAFAPVSSLDAIQCSSDGFQESYRQEEEAADKNIDNDPEISVEWRDCSEYEELIRLRRAKRLKTNEIHTGTIQHHGFTCDICGCCPIPGVRWHCQDCPSSPGTDLCASCQSEGRISAASSSHKSTHRISPVAAFSIKDTVYSDTMTTQNKER